MKTKKLKVKGWDKKEKKVKLRKRRVYLTAGKWLDLKNEAKEYVREGIVTSRPLGKKLKVSHPIARKLLDMLKRKGDYPLTTGN